MSKKIKELSRCGVAFSRVWSRVLIKTMSSGKIQELITSFDGERRAAKVILASHNIVRRPLNLVFPLECSSNVSEVANGTEPSIENNLAFVN